MKQLLVVTLLTLTSLVSFAGPEDHKDKQSCYVLENVKDKYLSAAVPSEICLESVDLSLKNRTVSVYSYFQPQLFSKLEITKLYHVNEYTYIFQAENTLKEDGQKDCQDYEKVTLNLVGFSDAKENVDVTDLKVTVSVEQGQVECSQHSSITTLVNYKLQ